mmetsp:Transcript_26188/g.48776  ORF Transcript_26188/g.48776 Transcript_26188/m.48776 type:complete len:124 (+) Transcript_26188:137-508(+)
MDCKETNGGTKLPPTRLRHRAPSPFSKARDPTTAPLERQPWKVKGNEEDFSFSNEERSQLHHHTGGSERVDFKPWFYLNEADGLLIGRAWNRSEERYALIAGSSRNLARRALIFGYVSRMPGN